MSATIASLRSGSPVGAWLLKANPNMWDIHDALRHREDLDWWRLAHSYRTALVAAGHPAGLWITGAQGSPRGLAAIGTITAGPELREDDPSDPRWGPMFRPDRRWYVGVTWREMFEPLDPSAFRHDPRTSGMEIFRAPRVASPVAVEPHEWDAILERCGQDIAGTTS